jgi:hypothetical protein
MLIGTIGSRVNPAQKEVSAMLNAKKLLCVLLSGLALVWMTPRACGATLGSGRLHLSGTYEFQGNLRNVDGRPVAISGNLDFDWLGDISGEALASLGRRHSPDANCNLLVMGNYAPDQQTYLATLTLTPVTTGCPFRHDETLEVRITPGDAEGTLYLNQISPGHHELSGLAKMESPGPVSAIEMPFAVDTQTEPRLDP